MGKAKEIDRCSKWAHQSAEELDLGWAMRQGKAEEAACLRACGKGAKGLFHAEIEGLLSLGHMEKAKTSKWHAMLEKKEESWLAIGPVAWPTCAGEGS